MNRPTLWKGLLTGFAGGLVASWAMGPAHALILQLAGTPGGGQHQGEDSTAKTARAITRQVAHRKLTPAQAETGGHIVHYAFGSSVAAVYGATAELVPAITRGGGLPFGTAVWLGAHVITVPALRLSPPVTQSSASAEFAEFAAHLVYGGLTELIRRSARRWLVR